MDFAGLSFGTFLAKPPKLFFYQRIAPPLLLFARDETMTVKIMDSNDECKPLGRSTQSTAQQPNLIGTLEYQSMLGQVHRAFCMCA
jgi:hypothetical protein